MKRSIEIREVSVISLKGHLDVVSISTDLPGTVPDEPLVTLKVELARGTGADWVRTYLNIEPSTVIKS